jgi:hypothetical protein
MGPFPVCPQDCRLWLVIPLWCATCVSTHARVVNTFEYPVPFLIMGRVTYLHHYVRTFSVVQSVGKSNVSPLIQLPTLYFSVLMLSHLLDHFIFSSRRFTTRTKGIVFGVITFIIFATWWWFKGVSFGIAGPINDHKGLQWRKVCVLLCLPVWFSARPLQRQPS